MSHRRLPVSLRDKITKYYEHRFQGKLFDEERLLHEVSRPLRTVRCDNSCLFHPEICSSVFSNTLHHWPWSMHETWQTKCRRLWDKIR